MKILSAVAIAAFVMTGMSKAADEIKPVAHQPTAAGQNEESPANVGTPTQTSGKVTSMHTLKMVGSSDAHVLVKIQTEQGDMDIADLGTEDDLKSNGIAPHEGQQLWVSGRVGRINDKELIIAENLSESKMITITRTAPLREESEKHAAARTDGKDAAAPAKDGKSPKTETVDAGMQMRSVDGTVIHTRNIKIEGEPEEHVLAKLQTESGIVVVDLGLKSALPKVDLSEGQWIAATGIVGHVNDKPIIVADGVGNLSGIQHADGKDAPEAARKPVPEKSEK
jgi:hypothetical protein